MASGRNADFRLDQAAQPTMSEYFSVSSTAARHIFKHLLSKLHRPGGSGDPYGTQIAETTIYHQPSWGSIFAVFAAERLIQPHRTPASIRELRKVAPNVAISLTIYIARPDALAPPPLFDRDLQLPGFQAANLPLDQERALKWVCCQGTKTNT